MPPFVYIKEKEKVCKGKKGAFYYLVLFKFKYSKLIREFLCVSPL